MHLDAARRQAHELNDGLLEIAHRRGITAVGHFVHWYGVDPIHIRLRYWREAWDAILSPWEEPDFRCDEIAPSLLRWFYLRLLAPEYRRLFGIARRRQQPCGRLGDATTISLF